ncbi:MAG: hypothetical protein PVJ67_02130 [Candidatus Pacearchaeota archaeon]
MDKEEYYEIVKDLRYNYSGGSQSAGEVGGLKMKIRKALFQAVEGVLVKGVDNGFLPEEKYSGELHKFNNRVRETKFYRGNPTREDIYYGNKILDGILAELELGEVTTKTPPRDRGYYFSI